MVVYVVYLKNINFIFSTAPGAQVSALTIRWMGGKLWKLFQIGKGTEACNLWYYLKDREESLKASAAYSARHGYFAQPLLRIEKIVKN